MRTKRFFAGAVAFIMTVMSTAAMTASAADTVTVTADKVTKAAGESFSLNVSLSGVPSDGIRACEFALKYDDSIIEVTGVKAGTITETGADAQETSVSTDAPAFGVNYATAGEIDVEWSTGLTSSDYWIKSDGVMFTVEGTVKSTAKSGDVSKIEIVPIDRALYEGSSETNSEIVFANIVGTKVTYYDVSTEDGSVTVAEDETSETKETTAPTETGDATSDPSADYGDVNVDGEINVADAVYLNKYLVNSVTLSAQGLANADAYVDGDITSSDTLAILQYLAMSITELPVFPE